MKVAYRIKYGGPEVLQIKVIPRPKPQANEVLIKVYATTVNRTDCGILWGKPFIIRFFTGLFKPQKNIPGIDFAGEVVEAGNEVIEFQPGDRVFGLDDNGLHTQAQYVCLPLEKVVAMPDNITYAQGAASLEGAHYAYNFINKVRFKKGASVLVNGATGAIGSAMIQLLTASGVKVTAVGPGEFRDEILERGATRMIDYTRTDFTEDQEHFDCVFDAVGKSTFWKCRKLLKPKGVYISSELGPRIQNVFLSFFTPLGGGKKVRFPLPTNCRRSVEYMKELIVKGKFKPLIDRSYPLHEIHKAYAYVRQGKKIGNVIVQPHDD